MFITHDFGVVAEIADRVVVMQHGVIVEQGTASDVLHRPQHPYTRQLIAAVPPLTAPPPRALSADNILTITDVSKTYRTGGFLGRGARVTPAVKNVSLKLPRGATLGIVGESGSGKSTLARCIVRLIDPDCGSIVLDGSDWAKMTRENVRRETRHIQMVFQDPFASLNPRRKAAELVAQGPIVHGTPRAQAMADAQGIVRAGRARSVLRRPLSARILRRPAPAHRAGARAGAEAGRAGRRRAGLGARRLRAGAGAETACRTAGAARHCRSSSSRTICASPRRSATSLRS